MSTSLQERVAEGKAARAKATEYEQLILSEMPSMSDGQQLTFLSKLIQGLNFFCVQHNIKVDSPAITNPMTDDEATEHGKKHLLYGQMRHSELRELEPGYLKSVFSDASVRFTIDCHRYVGSRHFERRVEAMEGSPEQFDDE